MKPPADMKHPQVAMKHGVLLINLGTPDAPHTPEVRRYLREFLSDPRVLDMPAIARFLLVNGVIVPFRAPKSAEAYQQIWGERGSPLLYHGLDLRDALREQLGDVPVELAMRYGKPSLAGALDALASAGCEQLLSVPLYPQHAASTTESSAEALSTLLASRASAPKVSTLPAFHADTRFLDGFAALGRQHLAEFEADHVLFSYHGLPEQHIEKADASGAHCLATETCCDRLGDENQGCYRAQCFATTAGLRERLELDETNSSTAFQSRLGRTPWIQPHTDRRVLELAGAGVKRLAVFCPAFVADCLETLEEIGMRARADFRDAGGEELMLIPSLNASPQWVAGLAQMIRERL